MTNKKIGDILRERKISPSLLNWGDDIVSSTKIWYDEETSKLCADCGVSISVDDSTDLAEMLIDIEDAIIKYYKQHNIVLQSSYV